MLKIFSDVPFSGNAAVLCCVLVGILAACMGFLLDYWVFAARRKAAQATKKWDIPTELNLIICIVGIYSCYISYGVIQEWIYSYSSPSGEKFSETLFLLFVQCFTNAFVAFIGILIFGSPKRAPGALTVKDCTGQFAFIGVSYIMAMLCSNESLKHVSYPTQALAKSCKMIPVMLMGFLVGGRQYSISEICSVLAITLGITVFRLSGKSLSNSGNSAYGLLLLFLSLVFDGVTGAKQDKLNVDLRPSSLEMMFYLNCWALILVFCFSLVTGSAQIGIKFCLENTEMLTYILLFSIASAVGQLFIFYTIKHFNSLILATITTTRKFFTILVSVFVFGHSLRSGQWGGVALVALGLTLELVEKYSNKHAKKSASNDSTNRASNGSHDKSH